ncbi:signal peptide peptidase SppA [Inquilinus limosus]|uniref:Signal peptide peptidase SppA n=1 Tax=Inquilinus limosus TaxID=171674 RepID=A0A211ZPU3_9PROT|nr:signal peptide peptidase SppA [Inquilinus limosus]OWJ67285.1 signal peptide peptidase SppA [Inquilinus limosus]
MGRFIRAILIIFGVLFLLLILAGGGLTWYAMTRTHPLPKGDLALVLDLRKGAPDQVPGGFSLSRTPLTLHQTIDAIDRAAADPRIGAIVARLSPDAVPLASAQELRDAIDRARRAGKLTVAHAEDLGSAGPGNVAVFLAAGFDQSLMMPQGGVGLTGISVEVPFVRDLLDTVGIQPEVSKRGQYKSAPETFTERDFTPASRAMNEDMAQGLYDQLVAGIAQGRALPPDQVKKLIDGGPYTAREAVDAKLVDKLAYWDEVDDLVDARAGRKLAEVKADDYLEATEPEAKADQPQVAVIYATGPIVDEPSDSRLEREIVGRELAQTIDDAVENEKIKAIVLRVDSPGGSVVASALIGRSVGRARDAGKPVVVSMGEAAASGGYWISAQAKAIVAEPSTLTGSIGIFAGKPVLQALWKKVGVSWGNVQRGRNAGIWTLNEPMDANGKARFEAGIDAGYDAFLQLVAKGRGMDPKAVDAIAQGRVWLGSEAVKNGLVDRLGGLDAAMVIARQAIGLGPDAKVAVVRLPRPRSALDTLRRLVSGSPLGGAALLEQAGLGPLAPVAERFSALAAAADGPVAAMEPLVLGR